jgi:hypothetical protein
VAKEVLPELLPPNSEFNPKSLRAVAACCMHAVQCVQVELLPPILYAVLACRCYPSSLSLITIIRVIRSRGLRSKQERDSAVCSSRALIERRTMFLAGV